MAVTGAANPSGKHHANLCGSVGKNGNDEKQHTWTTSVMKLCDEIFCWTAIPKIGEAFTPHPQKRRSNSLNDSIDAEEFSQGGQGHSH